jgi:hypothetical protein
MVEIEERRGDCANATLQILRQDEYVQSYSIPSGLLNGIRLTGSGDGVGRESLEGVWSGE